MSADEWRAPLLRRMLACADVISVMLGSLSLGFLSGNNVAALFWSIALAPAWVLLAKLVGLYDRDQRSLRHLTVDEIPLLVVWAVLGSVGVVLFLHLPMPGALTAAGAARLMIVTCISAICLRSVARHLWRLVTPRERTLIIGSDSQTEAIRRKIELFSDVHLEIVAELPEIDLEQIRHSEHGWHSLDRIIVATPSADGYGIHELAALGQKHNVRLSVVPLARSLFGSAVQLSRIADLPVLEYRTWDIARSTLLIKRGLDIVVSGVALVLLAPVFVVAAIAIKLDSRGPVIYSQLRAGLDGRPFLMRKFRTMVRDAEAQLAELVAFDTLAEPMFKLADDPRVTRVGRFLRRWSIDEAPQLFNVLGGSMSLVGPRPEQADLVERYAPEHRFRLSVKPGLTGPMQVYGRGRLRFQERLAVEREYIENLSLGRDLRILVMTIGAVLGGKGAL
jgi:exopolysaccharide biosynthesis polyprenyl glycosylphosphotransferase